jgi:hypothetical protein
MKANIFYEDDDKIIITEIVLKDGRKFSIDLNKKYLPALENDNNSGEYICVGYISYQLKN